MTIARLRELALVVIGFAALTAIFTYPQLRYPGTTLGTHYDTLFSTWRLAWIAHALKTDPRHLFDANIFWPERGTLAYSDAMLLPGFLGAPLIWSGLHPVVVHNILVLISFVAAGAAMYVLVRDMTGSRVPGWFSGIVFAFQAFRFAHYAQLELLWSWPIPIALWAFHRVFRGGRTRDGVLLGVAIALQTWSSVYYAIFLVSTLALLAPILAIGRSAEDLRRMVTALATGALVCVILVGPYALVYVRATSSVGSRSERDVLDWSPTLRHYLAVTPNNRLYGRWLGDANIEMTLFPGVTALIAAAAALWPPVNRTRIAYVVLMLLAFDLSLGFHGLTYAAVYRAIPIYRGLRVPARLFVIVSAALSVLGGFGLARLMRATDRAATRRAIAIAFIAAVLVESAPMPIDLSPVDREAHPVYSWLRQQPPSVVMEWPMPKPYSLGFTHEPLYMYYSIAHWQRLVNGYSGFYPVSYIRFLEETDSFPSPESVAYLRRSAVDFVILHGDLAPAAYERVRSALLNHPDFEFVAGSREHGTEVTLYRLRRSS